MPHRLRAATRRGLVVILLVVAGSCDWAWAAEKTDVASLTDPNATAPAEDKQSATPAATEPPITSGMDQLVSLDLRSTDVNDALKYLATKGGLNIAISKNVTGRVNLLLTNVPIHDVFDLVLRSNELAYDRQGTVYNVMTEQEYRALYGRKFSDLRQVKTFRLQYAVRSRPSTSSTRSRAKSAGCSSTRSPAPCSSWKRPRSCARWKRRSRPWRRAAPCTSLT